MTTSNPLTAQELQELERVPAMGPEFDKLEMVKLNDLIKFRIHTIPETTRTVIMLEVVGGGRNNVRFRFESASEFDKFIKGMSELVEASNALKHVFAIETL